MTELDVLTDYYKSNILSDNDLSINDKFQVLSYLKQRIENCFKPYFEYAMLYNVVSNDLKEYESQQQTASYTTISPQLPDTLHQRKTIQGRSLFQDDDDDLKFGETVLNNYRNISKSNILSKVKPTKAFVFKNKNYNFMFDVNKILNNSQIYNFNKNIYEGSTWVLYFSHLYLFRKHISVKNYLIHKNIINNFNAPLHFEIFHFPSNADTIDLVDGPKLNINKSCDKFLDQILHYFHNVNDGFTGFVSNYVLNEKNALVSHTVATVLFKNKNSIFLYIIDSNNNEKLKKTKPFYRKSIQTLANALTSRLSTTYKKYYPRDTHIKWEAPIILDKIHIQIEYYNQFAQPGYCAIIAYLILDLFYTNVMIYRNLDSNVTSDVVTKYLEMIQQHIRTEFNIARTQNLFFLYLSNYCYFLLRPLYIPSNNNKLEKQLYTVTTLNEIRHTPGLKTERNFKQLLKKFIIKKDTLGTCIGFQYTKKSKMDILSKPHDTNGVEYFIPTNIFADSKNNFLLFESVTRERQLKIQDDMSSGNQIDRNKISNHISINDLKLVFFNIKLFAKFFDDVNKKYYKMSILRVKP